MFCDEDFRALSLLYHETSVPIVSVCGHALQEIYMHLLHPIVIFKAGYTALRTTHPHGAESIYVYFLRCLYM